MRHRALAQSVLAVTVLALTALAASCSGAQLRGCYSDAQGINTYEFRDHGLVYVTTLEITVAATYRREDQKVLVSAPQGSYVLTQTETHLLGPRGQLLLPDTCPVLAAASTTYPTHRRIADGL